MLRIIVLLIVQAVCLLAQAGVVCVEDSLVDSKVYPSTVHRFTVTVPDSYSPDSAAALYVGLDGVLCNAPQVLDSLGRAGVMPPTIGVFLQAGVVCDGSGGVLRYNRSNEFDATDGAFSRFLAEELLPAVDGLKLADGRRVKLPSDPGQCMIFGLSSGGIAAFAAAWHRPDLFGKVFTGCGTFVAMRGGNDFQAIVRKHEPKPLCVFVQDGYRDAWNPLFGSWYEGNVMLASALKFAGYDFNTDWTNTGHSVARASEILADALTWMWSGNHSAEPTGNDFLAPRLASDSEWSTFKGVVAGPLGMAIYPDGSMVARAEAGSNWLLQSLVADDGSEYASQRFYWLHSYDSNPLTVGGMTFDADGYLWVVTSAGLQACDQNGRVRGILALPPDIDVAHTAVRIDRGAIAVSDGRNSYNRRLNIMPAQQGVRPKSQGQG
jgi:enterochelin esterase-like enzyme